MSQTGLLIGVVVVNYNGGVHLRRCLDALRAQLLQPDRVIVIDNASTDGSFDDIGGDYPEFFTITNQRNVGFAAANNHAIGRLAEEGFTHVALINPDAFPDSHWLEALAQAVRRHTGAASFASRMMMAESADRIDGLGDVYHVSGFCWRAGHGRHADDVEVSLDNEVFGACAGAALYDLQAVTSVGAFDEDFFCYVEDVDLAFRLRLAGYGCVYVAAAIVHHVGSASTAVRSDFATYYGQRNVVWTFVKNTPGALFWLLLPLHVVANVAAVVVGVWRGQGAIVLRAKRDALTSLRALWTKRLAVQRGRLVETREIWSRLDKGLWSPGP